MKFKQLNFIFVISFLTIAFTSLNAQENNNNKAQKREIKTIFGGTNNNTYISGFGALTSSYSRVKDENALFCGFRGGVILDNFVLGISGAGLVHPNKREDYSDNTYNGTNPYINFAYGGGLIEYHFAPQNLIHFSIGTTIGAGRLYFSSKDDDDDDNDGDKFFYVEPEANVFINVTRFCRLGVGASYRYVNGIKTEGYDDKDFNSASAKFIAAFGWF